MLLKAEIEAIADKVAERITHHENKLLTLEQVSRMLGKSPEAIKKMCQRERLPHHKHFGTLYFSSAEIKNYLFSKG